MSRIAAASQATQTREPSGIVAVRAASASSTPYASGRRRWCQVIVVLAGAVNSTSSSGPSTSMWTSAAVVSGSASSSVPTAGMADSSAASHQWSAAGSRENRPPGPATASLSPGFTRCAHSEAGPVPCSRNWISRVFVAGS